MMKIDVVLKRVKKTWSNKELEGDLKDISTVKDNASVYRAGQGYEGFICLAFLHVFFILFHISILEGDSFAF